MNRIVLCSTLILWLFSCSPEADLPVTPARLSVEGQNLFTPDGNVIMLRGVNWGWWGTAQPEDAAQVVNMSANVVRMPFRWYFGGEGSDIRQTGAPGNIKPEGLAQLDQYIDWCVEQKLWVILFAGSDQGAGDADENYWTSPALRAEFIETWEFLANRYKKKPYIAAYEILSEPHPKKPATSKDLKLFYEEVIAAIRAIDTDTPVMIGANDHYDINLMDEILTNVDDKIIYTFNFYLPTDYIKPDKREEAGLPVVSYPSTFSDFDGNVVRLDKDYLVEVLQPALQFRDEYHRPILINQVGARSRCPGHLQYMKDVGDIFFEHNVPFTYWTYRTRDDETQYGLYWYDKVNNVYRSKQDQIDLLKGLFSRN
jgi:Cellulase (glycosyl hydrolase family 5)